MATGQPLPPRQVGILILDDDPTTQGVLRQILDAEGWRVRIVPDTRALLAELATGEWSLVIANAALTGVDSPAFLTMKELASVAPEDGGRVRVLFLLPEIGAAPFLQELEQARLPFAGRPFQLHDFLEKVSDLLVEIKAIEAPIRKVRYEFAGTKKKKGGSRPTSMFAARDSYAYTEEELAEYEKQEQESTTLRKKRQKNLTDLGKP